MQIRRTLVKNAQFAVRNALGASEWTAFPLSLWPRYRHFSPDASTGLCLDGFSRSANSFLFNAVRYWNPGLKISHHLHLPVSIQRSVSMGIPTILLVRDPVDSVTSNVVADVNLSPYIAMQAWLSYYKRVLPYLDACVVATFEAALAVTPVLEETNRKFGCGLQYGELTPEIKKEIRSRLEALNQASDRPSTLVTVPTPEKESIKSGIKPRVARLPQAGEAYRLYEKVLQCSPWGAAVRV